MDQGELNGPAQLFSPCAQNSAGALTRGSRLSVSEERLILVDATGTVGSKWDRRLRCTAVLEQYLRLAGTLAAAGGSTGTHR